MPSMRSRDERVWQAATLALVGGFLDAYAYLAHGGVFANAQTGNVVLFGVDAALGRWPAALRHLPPLLAFLVGLGTVEALARLRGRRGFNHPVRLVLVVEAVTCTLVGLLPAATPSVLATILIAWAATLQIGTFRTVRSAAYNTTFTTGNIRSLVSDSAAWFVERDLAARLRAIALAAVVGSFAVGAVLGGLATRWGHTHAVLFVVPVLVGLLFAIIRETRRIRQQSG